MVAYASPSNLAQVTPGELSKDQAVPNFYYIDKNVDKFLLRWTYLDFPDGEVFWDSVATSLEVGSYITCLGNAGTDGELGLNVVTVRVVSITKAEPGYRYPLHVNCHIGPNSFFNNYNPGGGPGLAFRSNISGSNLVYRGIVDFPVVAGASSTTGLGGEGVDADCWCTAQVTQKPGAAAYPVPYVISWVEAGAGGLVTLHFATGAAPTAAGKVYVFLEAYKPLVMF